MWCHVVPLLPLAGLALFFVLSWPVALGIEVVLAAIAVGIAVPGMRALRQPVVTGREALIGGIAEAASDVEREGLVRYGGELWTATANGVRISRGTRVRIRGVEGVKLVITPIDSEGTSPAPPRSVGQEERSP